MRRALLALLVVAFAVLAGQARGAEAPAQSLFDPFSAFVASSGAVRTSSVAQPTGCRWRAGYSWPVRPFGAAHPIRGGFGDPRTVYTRRGRSFSFHNGVDIYAPDGTAVYPVVSGTVVTVRPDEIIVHTADGRGFQYWHLDPSVSPGRHVVARRTLLGHVRRLAGHVHLTEVDDAVVQNPLAPGHLGPYADTTPPSVRGISFRDQSGQEVGAQTVAGETTAVIWADDRTSLLVPDSWRGFPVAPARLTLQVETPAGEEVVAPQTVADFTATVPDPEFFWTVYASGTYQNVPAVGTRLYRGTPGRYLYTARLPGLARGSYRLLVTAADACGNTGSLSLPITVVEPTGPTAPPPAPPPVLPFRPVLTVPPARRGTPVSWPRGGAGYTVVLASLPLADGTRGAAAVASDAVAAKLPAVGVLTSSSFTSLAPGYRVVFSGVYRSAAEAASAASTASARYPGAYPRLIVPRAAPRPVVHRRRVAVRPSRGHYAVVVASVPESDGYRAARTEAERALAAGLGRARVVHSRAVHGLRAGFYVVLATGYREAAASAAVGRVAARYPTAYVRLLPARTASGASSPPRCPPSPSASPSCRPSSGSDLR